ncbi:response regulator [Paenibacillus sp. HB172176]|uniref:response regulator n=1 Tax=Paenibacillus sp. HB172176 TaxID=2493690 RepID=UPI001439D307|nr:response regulator [Paenibacillus sp. HB172176]
MYKLLIVDDEFSTRNGLKLCMNWADYGIEVAGEAENGKKGLELAGRLKPHIVLTDVKMPGMDGIEMVHRIKADFPDTKIVFISGYDDIDYLKSAMKMDAVDYILKPVNLEELTMVIEKIMKLSKQEASRKDMLQRMNDKLKESIPLLREKFLIQLIRDGSIDQTTAEKRAEFLELNLPYNAAYCALIIRIDNFRTVFEHISEQNMQLISFSIQNICQEIVEARVSGYIFEHQRGEYVLILKLPELEGEEMIFPLVSDLMDHLNGFLSRMMKISLTIGVGGTIEELGRLAESYQMAAEAIERRLFLGKNQVLTFDALADQKNVDYRRITERIEALASMLKTGAIDPVFLQLDALFGELRESEGIGYGDCQRVCLQVMLVTSQFLSEFGIPLDDDRNERESEAWQRLMKLETLDEMQLHLQHYLTRVCSFIEKRAQRKAPDVITAIIRIIQEQFPGNLTIADIASQVYLAKTYICMLFKQETGETINEYMTRVRMEKAKELLANSEDKLADICTAIGYSEPSYFTKQFRKHAGLNPSEYRDIHRRAME